MQPAIDLKALESVLAQLSDDDRKQIEELVSAELSKPFIPNPGPQTEALLSKADILLYGGAAGGGKTALMVGCAANEHSRALIVRREAVQLDGIINFSREILGELGRFAGGNENLWKLKDGRQLKFAGINQPDDWRKHAGNARDFMGFDEAGEFLRDQVFSLIGWLRSTKEGQRCRVILGSNPPRGGEGDWLIEEFAPWLDPLHSNPAKDGELRWAIRVGGETEWVAEQGEYQRGEETYTAMSRTFIPARLDDNPYLKDTNYRAVLQGLPEPLRSQLLKGDFLAGRTDHEWQVIPTEWVKLAQERWRKAAERRRRMIALSADIALGGQDNLVLGSIHEDNWFAPLKVISGKNVKDPIEISSLMMKDRRDDADLSVDLTGGWGSGPRSHLLNHHNTDCAGIVYSAASGARTYDGKFGFRNLRAEMWWKVREALDPEGGHDEKLMLPDDPRLLAELTTPRWKLTGTDILIESKEDIKKRVGSSPDRADVICQLWHRKPYAALIAVANKPPTGGWQTVAEDDEILTW
ncbi:terminase family protein [Ochrobactrum sp. SFR4]|uniref:terminase family protein n=1 Tax=Ochrobactrum sp. SFR4 TaxID=2717368 RepID=UPI001C8BF827|nr:terminase family protein [Ochrobactrum sp. SFR4]MBX8824745.1 terminase [Ochrobactrum sp. SFR4]